MNPFNSGRDGWSMRRIELRQEAWRRLRDVAERCPEVRAVLDFMTSVDAPATFFIRASSHEAGDHYKADDLIPLEPADDVHVQQERLQRETGEAHKLVWVVQDGDVYRRVA